MPYALLFCATEGLYGIERPPGPCTLGGSHTLSFGLDSTEGEPANLREAMLEARRVRNEVSRLAREGWDWDDIEAQTANLHR